MCYQGKIDLELMMLVVTKQGDNLDFEVYHQLMVQSGDVTRFAEEKRTQKFAHSYRHNFKQYFLNHSDQ